MAGQAAIDTASGASALLVMAQEAAFGGPGDIAQGQQVAFQRLRIRIDDAVPGATYTITSPYGVDTLVADEDGQVRMTDDTGCLSPPCGFDASLNGRIGPFLRWDPDVSPAAPEGYVGDPNVEHQVVGSPEDTNFFRVQGPGIGGPGVDMVQTDLFAVQGRIARPRATVSHLGDLYAPNTSVQIIPSFPGEASTSIIWTTDPAVTDEQLLEAEESDGTITVAASTEAAPNAVVELPEGHTALRYAVRSHDQVSDVYQQDYEVAADLPFVTASPAPPGGLTAPLMGKQVVTLTSNPVADNPIYFTTDGTRPRLDESGLPAGSTRLYTDPLTVTRSTTLKAIAVAEPTEESPSEVRGPVSTFDYVIHNLSAVSPDRTFGYPTTLTDIAIPGAGLPPVELELCLDDPLCPVVGELPDPTSGISFPGNFPDESFWWSGEASFDAGDTRARLILAAEAAFDSASVEAGHQVAFGRIRVRMDDVVPGATYEIVHPYGVVRATADDRGRVAYTDDVGCMTSPCGTFDRLLTQPVGPFLRWDPTVGPTAPEGYVGDPNVEHAVVGSPYDTNFFDVKQVTDGDGDPITPSTLGHSDTFAVQGKLVGPGVIASRQTGSFNTPLSVTLAGTRTNQIRYTTNGQDPRTNGISYNGPIAIGDGVTTLSYYGIGAGGASSMVESEVFTIDSTPPNLQASLASGSFTTAQDVTLTSTDPTAQISYTLNGSDPRGPGAQPYAGPIRVQQSSTLRATAIDLFGNRSPELTRQYTITPPPPVTSTPPTGTTQGVTPPTPGAAAAPTELLVGRAFVGPVTAGETTAINGVLAANGLAVGNVPVVLEARDVVPAGRLLGGPGWVDVATTTTATDGSFTFKGVAPSATTDYRVVFNGSATHAAMVSMTKRMRVRAVVDLAKPDKKVQRREKVTFRGVVAPAKAGSTVLVKLDGPGRADKRVDATVNRRGVWKVTTRAPGRIGRLRVVAVWRGDGLTLGGRSEGRTVRIVR